MSSQTSDPHFIALASPSDLPALRSIYEACFPVEEQVPWPEQAQEIETGRDSALVARRADGAVAGFALTTDLSADLTLLAYLAVDPTLRSGGVGAALFAEVGRRARGTGHDWVLIEVEPAANPADANYGDPRRRIHFYLQQGAIKVADGYAMPSPTANGPRLVNLDLYALPLGGGKRPDLRTVRGWVGHLWGTACYDEDPDSVLTRQVMERLRTPAEAANPRNGYRPPTR